MNYSSYKKSFGETIRLFRESKGLPLRKVAAYLDIDPSTLAKIERNERQATKDLVSKLAEILDCDSNTLLIDLLSDRVANELQEVECSTVVLKKAEQKIKYFKHQNRTERKT